MAKNLSSIISIDFTNCFLVGGFNGSKNRDIQRLHEMAVMWW